MFQLGFKKLLSALCPHSMFASFCYESKNKMVVSVVKSIDFFFSIQVKKLVAQVLFALLRDFLVLKRPFEACPKRTYYKTRNTAKRNMEHPRNIGTTEHHRNTGTRNTRWTTEQRRNNRNPPEQWKHRGTAEHYDRALAE